MPFRYKRYVWLAGAVITASLLLQIGGEISSGNIQALPWFIVAFIAFAIAAVGAVYHWHRTTDHTAAQQQLLETEQRNLEKGRHDQSQKT